MDPAGNRRGRSPQPGAKIWSGAFRNEETVDQDDVIDARVAPIANRLCRRLPTGDTADSQSALPESAGVLFGEAPDSAGRRK